MGYLAASFIVVWILAALYLLFMGIRQRRLEQEVQTLVDVMKERQADS